jgi:hypothetical protein
MAMASSFCAPDASNETTWSMWLTIVMSTNWINRASIELARCTVSSSI